MTLACIGTFMPVLAQENEPTGTARIDVYDPSGAPISDVNFTLKASSGAPIAVSGNNGSYTYGSGGTTITPYNGYLAIYDLPVGTYTISYDNNNPSYTFNDTSIYIPENGVGEARLDAISNNGSVTITLTGVGGTPLNGVNFHISAGSYNVRFVNAGSGFEEYTYGSDTLTTDASGRIYISSIAPGTYTLVQDNIPSGYNTGRVSESFSISARESSSVNVSNGREYATLTINAVDNNGNEISDKIVMYYYGIPVSVFSSGSGYEYTDTGAGITEIPVSGKVTIENLPLGEYNVHVSSVPEGYSQPEDTYVALNTTNPENITLTSQALDVKTTVKILDGNNTAADGFKVKVVSSSGDTMTFRAGKAGEYAYSEKGTVEELTTADDGTLTLSDLPEGIYDIVELSTAGYKNNKAKKTFTVTKGKASAVNFTAERSTATLALRSNGKIDAEGVAIKLTDTSGSVIFEGKTDKDGRLELTGVDDGEYTYTISSMPSGFINKKYTGHVIVKSEGSNNVSKIDVEESYIRVKAPAEGETVVLTNNSNKKEIKGIADANGYVTFIDLPDGEYAVSVGDNSEVVTIDRDYKGEEVDLTGAAGATKPTPTATTESPKPTEEPKENILTKLRNSKFLLIALIVLLLFLAGLIALIIAVANKNKNKDTSKAKEKEINDALLNITGNEEPEPVEESQERNGPLFIDADSETGLQPENDLNDVQTSLTPSEAVTEELVIEETPEVLPEPVVEQPELVPEPVYEEPVQEPVPEKPVQEEVVAEQPAPVKNTGDRPSEGYVAASIPTPFTAASFLEVEKISKLDGFITEEEASAAESESFEGYISDSISIFEEDKHEEEATEDFNQNTTENDIFDKIYAAPKASETVAPKQEDIVDDASDSYFEPDSSEENSSEKDSSEKKDTSEEKDTPVVSTDDEELDDATMSALFDDIYNNKPSKEEPSPIEEENTSELSSLVDALASQVAGNTVVSDTSSIMPSSDDYNPFEEQANQEIAKTPAKTAAQISSETDDLINQLMGSATMVEPPAPVASEFTTGNQESSYQSEDSKSNESIDDYVGSLLEESDKPAPQNNKKQNADEYLNDLISDISNN